MGKFVDAWLLRLRGKEEPRMFYCEEALKYIKNCRNHFNNDHNPIHLMDASIRAIECEIPVPRWVVIGLDGNKGFQKFRPLPRKSEGEGWLNSRKTIVMRPSSQDIFKASKV